ncbi:hypothetical protein AB205_0144590, partial [Aquarana catesbeiana]
IYFSSWCSQLQRDDVITTPNAGREDRGVHPILRKQLCREKGEDPRGASHRSSCECGKEPPKHHEQASPILHLLPGLGSVASAPDEWKRTHETRRAT